MRVRAHLSAQAMEGGSWERDARKSKPKCNAFVLTHESMARCLALHCVAFVMVCTHHDYRYPHHRFIVLPGARGVVDSRAARSEHCGFNSQERAGERKV